nr:2-amino-4-hydroxy-6-hydroxymethyldihydropteridine diphosphokinase [Clostridioides difficile]
MCIRDRNTEQADFLNMCVEIETEFEPYELLEYCQEIERTT